MENKDVYEMQDLQQNFQNFKCFIEGLNENSLKVNQSNFNLKMKLPVYTDCSLILSIYDSTFIKSVNSNSKKKSGTIIIIWTIIKFSEINKRIVDGFSDDDWIYLASLFPNFSQEKIKMRWFSSQKSVEQKFAWSEEEDRMLSNLINREFLPHSNENNLKWTEIAEKYNKMFPNSDIIRLGKHCRERWFNHLDPNIKKGDWTVLEDIRLLEVINLHGRKWSKIAKMLGSRNENSVKNRFFSLLNKFRKKKNIENDRESISFILKSLKEMSPSCISNNMIKKINLVNNQNKKVPKNNKTTKSPKIKFKNSFLEENINEVDEDDDDEVEKQIKEKNKEKNKENEEKKEEKVLHSRITRSSRRRSRRSSFESKISSLSLDEKKTRKKIKIEEEENEDDQMSSHSENLSKKNQRVQQEPERQIPAQPQNFRNTINQQPQLQNNFYLPSQNLFLTPEMHLQMQGFALPPYPSLNFRPTHFTPYNPYMYSQMSQMPIMDAINEEMARSMNFFPGFTSNNDIDLKNISHMLSSMSLTDEYLLEGHKMLSDLTFKSNSLSSLQDRLSFILPMQSSNKSNSTPSKTVLTPVSLQLKSKKATKKFTGIIPHPVNHDISIESNKNERKSTQHCDNVRNNLAVEHLEEVDIMKNNNQQQPMISFDKFLNNYSDKILPSRSFEFKLDDKPNPSLNQLE